MSDNKYNIEFSDLAEFYDGPQGYTYGIGIQFHFNGKPYRRAFNFRSKDQPSIDSAKLFLLRWATRKIAKLEQVVKDTILQS